MPTPAMRLHARSVQSWSGVARPWCHTRFVEFKDERNRGFPVKRRATVGNPSREIVAVVHAWIGERVGNVFDR